MSSLAKDDQIRLIFEDQLDRREITLPLLPEVAANVISLSTSEEVDAQQLYTGLLRLLCPSSRRLQGSELSQLAK